MLSKQAKQILEYLVQKIESRTIKLDDARTYVSYSEIHHKFGFEMRGKTYGLSLDANGMRELADWIKERNLPAITGLIVSKTKDEDRHESRFLMPGPGYFSVYGMPDLSFPWWSNEISKTLRLDWSSVLAEYQIQITYPDEIETVSYPEGGRKTVTVNAYERNAQARELCIEHWGNNCLACGINFEARYGEFGKGFIHVHHIKPLSEIGINYQVDPIKDLIPLCPNCHAMIHREKKEFTFDEINNKYAL